MRLLELKNKSKVVVVYGGGFQPFHQGHMSSYLQAKQTFPGADFYVAASNDTKTRPIPFEAKQFLAQQAGVVDPFVQVSQPINPREILANYNPDQDILVLVRSERDPMSYTKKDGSPGYYQPFVSIDQCEPFTKHGYILVTKKHVFDVNGEEVYSGSQVRTMYAGADDAGKANIIKQLYPKARDQKRIKQVFDQYLSQQGVAEDSLSEFALGSGGGESGRWYTDDQMTDLVGDGWWEDMDVSGNIPKQQMIQQAQAWLDDQGYSVQVLNAKLNDDDMDWYIEGNFHNPNFAKKGVAEGLGKDIKRGMAGWGAFDKDKPADVVKRVKGQDTDTLKTLSRTGPTGKGSPAELQQKAISRELKKREQQGVAEGLSLDEQFDIIEEMVEQLAEQHGVDAEQIWEDFESVDDTELYEAAAWQKKSGKNKNGGLNAKGVASYRRENPGSKLQTAVTTKPSKLKKGSKAAKRRKSFCARMGGVKGPMKKPNGKPTRKALALRKWNC